MGLFLQLFIGHIALLYLWVRATVSGFFAVITCLIEVTFSSVSGTFNLPHGLLSVLHSYLSSIILLINFCLMISAQSFLL